MKFFKVMVLLMSAQIYVLSGCGGGGSSNDTSVPPKTQFAIGDIGPSGVGIVFYITDGGLHGLEAAPSGWHGGTTDPNLAWSNITNVSVGAAAENTAIGTGLTNSNATIAQTGHTSRAAKLCRDYTGGGKADWFLPSLDELNRLYDQRAIIDGITADYYWSSTEDYGPNPSTHAYVILFTPASALGTYIKSVAHYVRPVRAF